MSIYTDSDKKLLEKVFEYKNSKRFSEALKVLKPLEKRFKNDKVVIGLIATIYFERGKYIQSTKYFKRATILNPNSEISSLGLFHSLINVGEILTGHTRT